MLETVDWSANPAAGEFGRYGAVSVRYGKALKGGPPRRRTVLTTMGWAAEAVAEWVEEIRPLYGSAGRALWPTERRERVSSDALSARFADLPRCARAGREPGAALPAPLLRQPPARRRLRPPVRPAAARPLLGLDDGDLHQRRRGLQEPGAAPRTGPGHPGDTGRGPRPVSTRTASTRTASTRTASTRGRGPGWRKRAAGSWATGGTCAG